MSAGLRLSRMLALVPWLTAHPGVTLSQTADHFGISINELESDLNVLVCSGLPGHGPDQLIDIDFWNDDGRIVVIDPQGLTRPLRLTSDEATALVVGLRILEQVPGDHDRSAIATLAEKLRSAAATYADDVIVHPAVGADSQLRDALDDCLRTGSGLHIAYAGITRDEVSERTIWPRAITVQDGHAYISAWCGSAGAVRTFRADRVLRWSAVDEPAPDPGEGSSPESAPVAVRLSLDPDAWWFVEAHGGQPQGEPGTAVFHAHHIEWAARSVLALGGSARALEPPELVARVRELCAAALDRYDR